MEFVTEIPVRFGETDPAGVVYYPRYFHYYHCAFESFFAACHGVDYATWTTERHVGFPTRHIEADFERPLRYGDIAKVAVSIPRLGTKSLDFRFVVTDDEGASIGWGLATKVCVDMQTFESRAIPDELRKVFARYPGRSDHQASTDGNSEERTRP